MVFTMKTFLILVILSVVSAAQQPEVEYFLEVEDGIGNIKTLAFGLDPSATNLIDTALGESPLPPFPPAGAFEVRFILENLEGVYEDYRQGDSNFSGDIEHSLRYQTGSSTMTFRPLIPDSMSITFVDPFGGIVFDTTIQNGGEAVVTNPQGLDRLLMIVHYIPVVSVEQSSNSIPGNYHLYGNYPNPFNPSTQIRYDLPEPAYVNLTIYDVKGEIVETLVSAYKPEGSYSITFNAEKLSSGVYFCRMETKKYSAVRKMVLVR